MHRIKEDLDVEELDEAVLSAVIHENVIASRVGGANFSRVWNSEGVGIKRSNFNGLKNSST